MIRYQDQRNLKFTPEQLFDLVLDVESYPIFLPWCKGVRKKGANQNENFDADLVAGYGPFTETLTCRVTYKPHGSIYVQYLQGPFKHLETTWEFIPIDAGTCLKFKIEFEFSRSFLNQIARLLLLDITEKMVDAFVSRAKAVYTPNPY